MAVDSSPTKGELRASVLDAALSLGIRNSVVARWVFDPIAEGEDTDYDEVSSLLDYNFLKYVLQAFALLSPPHRCSVPGVKMVEGNPIGCTLHFVLVACPHLLLICWTIPLHELQCNCGQHCELLIFI